MEINIYSMKKKTITNPSIFTKHYKNLSKLPKIKNNKTPTTCFFKLMPGRKPFLDLKGSNIFILKSKVSGNQSRLT